MSYMAERWLSAALAEPGVAALEVMRLSLVDWLACGLAGQGEPVAQQLRGLAEEEGGTAQATLFGGGQVPARMAALVNGATSHALDYDDTHFAHIGHPSVAVIPAALAVAERERVGFDLFLRACLAGCEASIRLGMELGRSHYQIGYHQTATAGAFGATVAAGLLLGLEPDRMGHALGLVSTRASGLKSQFGTMGKPYNAGLAAANGVEAALLAARGFVSNPDALRGQNGFFPTHHAEQNVVQPDGWMKETISHKFHACCHGLHATLEALETLKPVDVDHIQSIDVVTHPRWMTVCNQQEPRTGLEAKFSYRAVVALSLLGHDTASLASYDDRLMQDASVRRLMTRVNVTSDERLGETQAQVDLRVTGGALTAGFDLEAPVSLSERAVKIRHKAHSLTGSDRIWDAVASHEISQIQSVLGGNLSELIG